MFLQVCVCPRGGGCLPQCMLGCQTPPPRQTRQAPLGPGRPPLTRQTPPPDQTSLPWTRHPPWTRQTPGTRQIHPPRDQADYPPPGSRLQHTVYERPVRILLECILVCFCSCKESFSISNITAFSFSDFNLMQIYSVYFAVFNLHWVTVRWRFAAVHLRFVTSQRRKHSGEPETHSHRCVRFVHTSICVCLPHCQGSHSDWKTWKNGKAFSSQGKVQENHTKYWKTQGIPDKYYLFF